VGGFLLLVYRWKASSDANFPPTVAMAVYRWRMIAFRQTLSSSETKSMQYFEKKLRNHFWNRRWM